jgi:phenylpropionate dioxygenase-like ring-hydroxylating dioxygenase large terminal subunit
MPLPYGWFAVCYSDELNAGDVKPLRYFAKDLVVFRGESGAVHVLDAFCPHLGAHLGHGGEVHGDTIACPFHGWRFDGDACIVDVPYASKMPPRAQQQTGIGSYPVREANGMIWVWHDAENKAPQFEVEVLEEAESDEWQQVRFDWKIGSTIQEMGENAVDGPHFQYVHGSVVPPEFTAEINDHLRKSTIISKMPVLDDEGNKDVQSGQVEESVTESWSNGAGQAWQRFARLPYSILMGSVTAIDHDNVHLRFTFVQKKQLDEMQQLFVDGATQVFKEQVEQDIPIWENKVYHEDPILCDGDGPIHKYRRWFSQFYQGQQ